MVNHHALDVLSTVVGWIYFFAWSFSFYPQVILNWRRKSVHGLSFDYQNYNILGFFSYSVYNVVLYWSPYLQLLYAEKYDGSTPDVALNDVVFALHAVVLTSVTIFQCFIYESRGQVVSIPSMVLASLAWISLYIMTLLTVTGATNLDMFFLINYFSYVKAGVTAVKYIPQAYLNYARKSTVGWSIGNVLLDFTGGTFSLFQQIIDSINADDWTKLYGNPAKLALALLSLFFDTLFMIQHYVLYREKSRKIEELESAGLVNPGTDLDEHSSPFPARREESEEDRSGYSFFGTRFGEKKKVVLGRSG